MARDQQSGNACAWPELVVNARPATLPGRRHVIPSAAKLVVGHHHQGVVGVAAAVDRLEEVAQMLAARID